VTARGIATRSRIVAATADRILQAGLGGMRLGDVLQATGTSKSQVFHYFPGGKDDLVRAVADFQGERVLEAQRPHIDELESWTSWDAWMRALLAYYDEQDGWGCPIGTLTAEAAGHDPALARQLTEYTLRWRDALATGVARTQRAGLIDPTRDPVREGTAILAAIQGGLLLTVSEQALWPLEAALETTMLALGHP
jgi:AcrR family transcriptional regulator